MNITPEFIQKKEFHVTFKGYSPEEVDKFLDLLSLEFEKLTKRNRELEEKLDKLQYEGYNPDEELKKIFEDVVISAHKIAEEIKAKAKREAEEIIQNKKAQEEINYQSLLRRRQELEDEIKYIQSQYEEFKTNVKSVVEEFEKLINGMDVSTKLYDIKGIVTEDNAKKGEYYNIEEQEAESEEMDLGPDTDRERLVEDELKIKYTEEMQEDGKKNQKDSKKRIDIANPDVINEFFKPYED